MRPLTYIFLSLVLYRRIAHCSVLYHVTGRLTALEHRPLTEQSSRSECGFIAQISHHRVSTTYMSLSIQISCVLVLLQRSIRSCWFASRCCTEKR